MRALGHSEAVECETAAGDTCKCRCNGAYHGARRLGTMTVEDFQNLPLTDPHHLPNAEELAASKERARFRAFVKREHVGDSYSRERQAGRAARLRFTAPHIEDWLECPLCIEELARKAVPA